MNIPLCKFGPRKNANICFRGNKRARMCQQHAAEFFLPPKRSDLCLRKQESENMRKARFSFEKVI